jgi:hypothetical protein
VPEKAKFRETKRVRQKRGGQREERAEERRREGERKKRQMQHVKP